MPGVLTPAPPRISEAKVDVIHMGKGYGDVASRLLANHMDPYALRTNATLRYEEWQEIDDAIQPAVVSRCPFVKYAIGRGLEYRMKNGLAAMVLGYENVSDMNDAEIGMDAAGSALDDRLNFEINFLPLPCVYKSFSINIRQLEAGRLRGDPIDVTQAVVAGQKVGEKIEQISLVGASSFLFGGGYKLQGLLDFDYVNTGSMDPAWDDSAATGATITTDVLAMKQASLDDGHGGPWGLLVPPAYETKFDQDYSTAKGENTIRDRILKIGGVETIMVCDKLTAGRVVLVELQMQTFRVVNGLEPMSVEWDEMGGLRKKFRVIAIMVPQPRADQANKCGIQVWS